MSNTALPAFGLPTAGVWWPGRTLALSDNEYCYALDETASNGRKLMAKLAGYAASSTRDESLGVVLLSFAPLPVHGGIDYSGAVGRASDIIKWISSHLFKPYHTPFPLINDGGLRALFFLNVHSRGSHTIKISKVKGHDTEGLQHLDDLRRDAAVGNQIADAIATEARKQMFSLALVKYADYLAHHVKSYIIFCFSYSCHYCSYSHCFVYIPHSYCFEYWSQWGAA